MLETSKKYVEEANKVKDSVLKALSKDTSVLETMDSETLDFLQAGLRYWEASNELILKQAETIDEMNNKLDQLLRK